MLRFTFRLVFTIILVLTVVLAGSFLFFRYKVNGLSDLAQQDFERAKEMVKQQTEGLRHRVAAAALHDQNATPGQETEQGRAQEARTTVRLDEVLEMPTNNGEDGLAAADNAGQPTTDVNSSTGADQDVTANSKDGIDPARLNSLFHRNINKLSTLSRTIEKGPK